MIPNVQTSFLFVIFGWLQIFNGLAQKLPSWKDVHQEAHANWNNGEIVLTHYFATWCKPCMEELPVFDSLAALHLQNVSYIFICLDFKNSHALYKKIEQLDLPGNVYFLEPRNEQMGEISERWNGTLPYTIINRGTKEHLLEGRQKLKSILQVIETYENEP